MRSTPALLILVVVAAGCSAGEGLGGVDGPASPPMGGSPPTAGGSSADCAGAGRVSWAGRCLDVPASQEAACEIAALLSGVCVDADGDCAVAECAEGVPVDLVAALLDCDDARVEVHPFAEELCDHRDDDCDGEEDEGYLVGAPCEACGGAGKTECAAGDPRATACSTAPGQSAAPDPATRLELCDGRDDDCDGEVDEACQVDIGLDPSRRHPALCGDRLLFVDAEGLRALPLDAQEAPPVRTVEAGAQLAHPACEGDRLAWLVAPEPCGEAEDGPYACPRAQLFSRVGEGPASARTGLAAVGPPIFLADSLWWHEVDLADAPGGPRRRSTLYRAAAAGGGAAAVRPDLSLSDPRGPPLDDRLFVRRWTAGAPEIVLAGVTPDALDLPLSRGGWVGPPVSDGVAVVWPLGRPRPALWIAHLDAPADPGFQITRFDGAQRAPHLLSGRLLWLDEGLDPPALRVMNLETGATRVLFRGAISPQDLTARGDTAAWITAEGALHRHRFPPSP